MRTIGALAMIVLASSAMADTEPKLPPEVTPALRAACEADVRRVCPVTSESSISEVRACVLENFKQLGRRCQAEITLAGLR